EQHVGPAPGRCGSGTFDAHHREQASAFGEAEAQLHLLPRPVGLYDVLPGGLDAGLEGAALELGRRLGGAAALELPARLALASLGLAQVREQLVAVLAHGRGECVRPSLRLERVPLLVLRRAAEPLGLSRQLDQLRAARADVSARA